MAARHLFHFGYKPVVHYPKPTNKPLYKVIYSHGNRVGCFPPLMASFQNLRTQLTNLDIPFLDDLDDGLQKADLVLDAIFGVFLRVGDRIIRGLNSIPRFQLQRRYSRTL